jgi:NTP pyrophosphatase (non-canonical NTP hydrolase)
MNDFIKELSIQDKKTLSQKALKTCEEVGELAKAILPFDSAAGTNHRFVDREQILEEIADVYLTNISIAYSLGFSDEEINDMIYRKSLKWSEIQSKESESPFPLPFEIHITVDGSEMIDPILFDRKKFDIDYFKRVCKDIGVKPIVLDLETNSDIIKDTMTSSKFFGDNRSVYDESQRIVNSLEESGFEVLRTKIETVPWHSKAPKNLKIGEIIPDNCYFESHIGISIFKSQKEILDKFVEREFNSEMLGDFLNIKIKEFGSLKLSSNFFKKSEDKFINIITFRSSKVGYTTFKEIVELIKKTMNLGGFDYEKVEIEFCIYDTNLSHDNKWMLEGADSL